ncbi:hypothetical protein ACLKA6_005614 [Drosophila palustris]
MSRKSCRKTRQDETRRDAPQTGCTVVATLQSGSDKRCHATMLMPQKATGAAFWVAVMAGLAFDIAAEVEAAALFN